MKKNNFSVSDDLQANIRFEPNACRGYVLDLSLGCPHQCVYCLFMPLELLVYKLKNPGYKGNVVPFKIDTFLLGNEFPPAVYLSYSCDPLGNAEITGMTIQVLKKLYEHNVSVFFISKGIFNDEILEVIKARPDLMEIQVGITNSGTDRNSIVEPGAPSYEQRMENLEKLARIEGLGSLTVRIDPMLPNVDDTPENIDKILNDAKALGVKDAVLGYIILTRRMREKLRHNEYLAQSAEALTERVETISEQELYSIPLSEKMEKLSMFEEMCRSRGIKMSVCGCKDHQLKNTDLSWICHPYNRKRREELGLDKNADFEQLVEHIV